MGDVVTFDVFANGLYDTIPLYDDNNDLIGGAAPSGTNMIKCFVAAKGHPVSLNLTSSMPVYISFQEKLGMIRSGIITIVPQPTHYFYPFNVRTE